MRFNVSIKPSVYTGHGTYRNAMDRFHSVTPLCCSTYSGYGNYYGTFKSRGSEVLVERHFSSGVYPCAALVLAILAVAGLIDCAPIVI